jgi:hypothetical protein
MRFTLGLSECREIGGGPFLGTILSAEEALCTLYGTGDQNAASCKMEWVFPATVVKTTVTRAF